MARKSIDARFEEFDRRNPHIYLEIVKRAQRLQAHGATRIGIGAIFESIRYDAAVKTLSDDHKMDNSFRSRYARKLVAEFPELAPLIERRKLRPQLYVRYEYDGKIDTVGPISYGNYTFASNHLAGPAVMLGGAQP